jgi:hypothetical protein
MSRRQGCGGPWGYAELLDAIKNPKHERHEGYDRSPPSTPTRSPMMAGNASCAIATCNDYSGIGPVRVSGAAGVRSCAGDDRIRFITS